MTRFGECSGREHFTLGHRRKEFPLQFLAAKAQNTLSGKAGKNDGAADGGILGAQRIGDNDVFQNTKPLAGILFRIMNADKS